MYLASLVKNKLELKALFQTDLSINDAITSITGVLAAYKGCISRIQLYGPTNFAPTILHVANIARQYTDGSQYFILLIITDGIITDMPQTKKVKKTSNIEYSEF